jgi:RNA polymerase sigma factor (sigma-70 family)
VTTDLRAKALNPASADADAHAAFGELVKRYQDAAFGSAYAILKDRAAAEDVTQAAFLTAWLRRHDLREPLAFGSWLRTIVRTECFRSIRRQRVVTVPLEDIPSMAAASVPDNLSRMELRGVLL